LEKISSGTISIGNRVVNELEPKDRGIAMVFQNYALYPHMTIFNNMAFGLQLAKKKKDFIQETVTRTSQALGLNQMLERKPQALSGGQRQRVALGRAIVRNPQVFLFDEPLSNLDAKMRVQMRSEISRLHGQLGSTMIYVTHDQVEAMTMGDRICVMKDGVIMQVADPLTLYRKPENLFVAGFIGSPPMNLLRGKVQKQSSGLVFTEAGEQNAISIPIKGPLEPLVAKYVDKPIVLGVRPEHITEESKNGTHVPLTSAVDIAEPMGSESLVYMKAGGGNFIAKIHGEKLFHQGEPLTVYVDTAKILLFDPETEAVIR
jgi:multiple sugar transport system ATP-binding protein